MVDPHEIEIDDSRYTTDRYLIQRRPDGLYHVSELNRGPDFGSISLRHWVHSIRSLNHFILKNEIPRSKITYYVHDPSRYNGRPDRSCNCGLNLGEYSRVVVARHPQRNILEVKTHAVNYENPTTVNYIKILKTRKRKTIMVTRKVKRVKKNTEDGNPKKKKSSSKAKAKSTKTKKGKADGRTGEKGKRDLAGHIMLSDICEEMDVSTTAVRRLLRNSDIEKPGSSWAWPKGDSDIKRVKQLIKTGE